MNIFTLYPRCNYSFLHFILSFYTLWAFQFYFVSRQHPVRVLCDMIFWPIYAQSPEIISQYPVSHDHHVSSHRLNIYFFDDYEQHSFMTPISFTYSTRLWLQSQLRTALVYELVLNSQHSFMTPMYFSIINCMTLSTSTGTVNSHH